MDTPFFRKNAQEENFAIHIDFNGQWYHNDTPIARDTLSQLFSTVLHYDEDKNEYWLVTPVEQGRIIVEDVPYIITDFEFHDDGLQLTTNLNHEFTVNENHPISYNPNNGLCYAIVHGNVRGRLNRNVREKFIEIALNQGGYDKNTGQLSLNISGIQYVIAKNEDDNNAR